MQESNNDKTIIPDVMEPNLNNGINMGGSTSPEYYGAAVALSSPPPPTPPTPPLNYYDKESTVTKQQLEFLKKLDQLNAKHNEEINALLTKQQLELKEVLGEMADTITIKEDKVEEKEGPVL